MLTYTAEALKALDVDHPPLRAVCKTLFTLHLWRPKLSQASRRRSADRSMSIAWLNIQSLRNKTETDDSRKINRRPSTIQRRGTTAATTCVCVLVRHLVTRSLTVRYIAS